MINYAMDEIRFESLASCFRVFAKGWILSKEYVVSVRCNGKEIHQFHGNQKRYDICIAYHVEITEDDYGFEESFDMSFIILLVEKNSVFIPWHFRRRSITRNPCRI